VRRSLALAALVAGALPAAAQDVSLTLGGSRSRYADTLHGSAGFVGLRVGAGRGSRALEIDAAVSRFTAGGWAIQAGGQGTALWPVGRGTTLLGFAAGASLNHVEGGVASGIGAAGPLLTLRWPRAHVAAGASAGAYRTIGGGWGAVIGGALHASWLPHPRVSIGLGGAGIRADTLGFADANLQVRVVGGPLRVGLLAGTRLGDLSDGPWGSVEAAAGLGSRVAVEASAGWYPRDVTGFAEGAYAQVGIRVFALRAPAAFRPPRDPVEIRRLDDGRLRLALRYRAGVSRLEIAGDWNGWRPMPLRPDAGRWVAELEVAAGTYAYALIADGDWVLPDGVQGVDDGFGGRVARLIVPR
jgi:hypothetical protein